MKFPPLQMDNPYFELELEMRYKRGAGGELISTTIINEPPKTLAVLPFDNIVAGAADDGFNEGLRAGEERLQPSPGERYERCPRVRRLGRRACEVARLFR